MIGQYAGAQLGSSRRVVIRQQGRLSMTRLALGCLTFGLSLPFTGTRIVRKVMITRG